MAKSNIIKAKKLKKIMEEKQNKDRKGIVRFEPQVEQDLFKSINKMFPHQKESISEEDALKLGTLCMMDPSNVSMIVAKTEEAKRLLSRFIAPTQKEMKIPKLDYHAEKGEEIVGLYSLEYLESILNIFNASDSTSVKISVRKQYPLTIQNHHFTVILAPRVEEE